jgi:MYXO-CTERM domain-containing protein
MFPSVKRTPYIRCMCRLAVAAAVACAAGTAWANGRPPFTNGVAFRPGDAQSIYVRTTFGFLISRDDGCHFDWVCEQNVGYGGQFDPKYAIATDGTIFATTFTGLRVSRDGGCSFATATATLPVGDPNRIADLWIDALEIGPTGEVWVGTSESGKPNDVYRSTDNGTSFQHAGMQSPTIFWKSIKIARSDPRRIYITGYQVAPAPLAHLLHSVDDGAHWIESPLANVMFGSTPLVYAMAVDATNADVVFVISAGANPPNGDRLYRSTDAGQTLAEVLVTTQPIADVVIRDAANVAVATGPGGSFVSTNGGMTFSAMANPPQLLCLGQRSDGQLFGCGQNWDPDFKAVSRSTDAASWQKVFRFVELDGPLACPAGTAEHDVCAPLWPGLRDQFGSTGSTCGLASDPPAGEPPAKKSGGCCEVDGGPGGLVVALGAGGLLLRRRRQ